MKHYWVYGSALRFLYTKRENKPWINEYKVIDVITNFTAIPRTNSG